MFRCKRCTWCAFCYWLWQRRQFLVLFRRHFEPLQDFWKHCSYKISSSIHLISISHPPVTWTIWMMPETYQNNAWSNWIIEVLFQTEVDTYQSSEMLALKWYARYDWCEAVSHVSSIKRLCGGTCHYFHKKLKPFHAHSSERSQFATEEIVEMRTTQNLDVRKDFIDMHRRE